MNDIRTDQTATWSVTIYLDEHGDQTRARARLSTGVGQITGTGVARRNPVDREVPEIGAELAAARALTDLAHELVAVAVDDIEAVTKHRPALSC